MRKYRAKKSIVYAAINITNGKRYIGITSGPLRRRITEHFSAAKRLAHNGAFYRALRKYGRGSFEWVILQQCESYVESISAEISLISKFKPEYNSTKGGDGQLGRPLSDDARKKISVANTGNKFHLGHSHSEETRERLRQIGLENKSKWEQYSHLGPEAMARSVICLTDNKTYSSASEAARAYGVSKSSLIELCLGSKRRRTVGGHVFKYIDSVQ